MRHKVLKRKKFNNKDKNHRDAMIRNLVGALIDHGSIETTEKRAKVLIPVIDRLINVAKGDNKMNAIRQAGAVLYTEATSKRLFERAEQAKDRNSGYTRITPIRLRDGDNAKIVKVELI